VVFVPLLSMFGKFLVSEQHIFMKSISQSIKILDSFVIDMRRYGPFFAANTFESVLVHELKQRILFKLANAIPPHL
jgi:hypothetical protein